MWLALLAGWFLALLAIGIAEGAEAEAVPAPGLVLETTHPALERALGPDEDSSPSPKKISRTRRLQEALHKWLPASRNLRFDGDAVMVAPSEVERGRITPYVGMGRSEAMESIRDNEERAFVGASLAGERSDLAVEVDDRADGLGVSLTFRFRY